MDVLEINIVISCAILMMCVLAEPIRKRFGAKWMKAVWLILAVRLLIPYNFSLPSAKLRLLNDPAFEQEKRDRDAVGDSGDHRFWSDRLAGILGISEAGDLETGNPETGNAGNGKAASGSVGEDIAASGSAGEDIAASGNAVDSKAASGAFTEGSHHGEMSGEKGDGAQNAVSGADAAAVTADAEGMAGAADAEHMTGTGQGNAAGWKSMPGFGAELLAVCWLLGCLILGAVNLVCYAVFRARIRRSLMPVQDKEMKRQIYAWEREMLGKRAVPVFLSEQITSPMLVGYRKPMLLLPDSAVKDERLRLVIRHELTHYQKKDLWGKLLMQAAWILNWFDPLVYWMKRQFAYDMEMACDSHVLRGKSAAVRESYARTMLSYAGKRSASSAFTTTFYGNKDRVKRRIDNMLDRRKKKNGAGVLACVAALVLGAGLLISCGYKPEEGSGTAQAETGKREPMEAGTAGESGLAAGKNEQLEAGTAGENGPAAGEDLSEGMETGTQAAGGYDVNNAYNQMLCYDGTYTYVSWETGIYRKKDGEDSFQMLFKDHYGRGQRRGMALLDGYLYFCGAAPENVSGDKSASCIYRMNTDSLEAEQLSEVMPGLFALTIYENKLYAAMDGFERIGFSLGEDGRLAERLDENREDFLYFTYNKERRLWLDAMNAGLDTEEYWEKIAERNELYVPAIDPAWGKEMLDGDMVVSHYKNEYDTSMYLEKADGTREFLCDYAPASFLITENGVYYFADDGYEIWYVDYGTKTQRMIYEKPDMENSSIDLCNYDADHLYYVKSVQSDTEQADGVWVTEYYLCRVLREGGEEEVLRKIEGPYHYDIRQECAVAGDYFYFQEGKDKVLDLKRQDWAPDGLFETEEAGGTEE